MSAEQVSVVLVEMGDQCGSGSIKDKLLMNNFELMQTLEAVNGLRNTIEQSQPKVVVLSVDVLDADALQELTWINEHNPVPVVVFAQHHAPEVIKMVVEAGVSSYIVDDVQAHRLPVIIDLAINRFAQFKNLNTELQMTKEKLSERKLIEKAKGIIMQQKNLSEDQAYTQIRRTAMNQGENMASISKRIISVFEMLN